MKKFPLDEAGYRPITDEEVYGPDISPATHCLDQNGKPVALADIQDARFKTRSRFAKGPVKPNQQTKGEMPR